MAVKVIQIVLKTVSVGTICLFPPSSLKGFHQGGGERKLSLFFEDIPVPGNGANHVPIKKLLGDGTNETVRNIEVPVLSGCP